jgi:hypothetical protein
MDSQPQDSALIQCRIPIRGGTSRWYVRPRTIGVYRLVHLPNDACYVGSSKRCIENRLGWHLYKLRQKEHTSTALQEEFDHSVEEDWELEILELCTPELCYDREKFWFDRYVTCLCSRPACGYILNSDIREKLRTGRQRYLATPGARESLSKRAKIQHQNRNFGAHTWK